MQREPIDDLALEGERIDGILSSLSPDQWAHSSGCPGWTVQDVVLHLAQTEEAVVASVEGGAFAPPAGIEGSTVDEVMAAWVRAQRGTSWEEVLSRWRAAHRRAVEALEEADPERAVPWAAAPLKPRTLATTRLSEHWIHTLDITDPLGLDYPDTERLWHIARLAHRTIPYAYARAGRSTIRLLGAQPTG